MDKNFGDLLNEMETGKSSVSLLENIGIGADRADDIRSEEDKAAAFQQIAMKAASDLPYVDQSWVERIADQLRQGESAAELAQMAGINREQYAGSARIDVGGNFDTWDVIQRSLLALPTDALPPAPAQLS